MATTSSGNDDGVDGHGNNGNDKAVAAPASAPSATRISEADVASVVLSYLGSQGFDRAAAAFRR